jgi:hypothetical protein
MESVITLTFGDCAENHVGMQKIGTQLDHGLSEKDMFTIRRNLRDKYLVKSYLYRLNDLLSDDIDTDLAYILIIPNGLNLLFDDTNLADNLYNQLINLEWDTKAKMRGKVVNKHARYNLCFGDTSQEADFEVGKGTIVNFQDIPDLRNARSKLSVLFGPLATNLAAEGSLYYDVDKCYIGYHGDSERKIVIAARLGADFKLKYQWYHRFKTVGEEFEVTLHHGDMYVMSDKAVGHDWKKSSLFTLRHSASS